MWFTLGEFFDVMFKTLLYQKTANFFSKIIKIMYYSWNWTYPRPRCRCCFPGTHRLEDWPDLRRPSPLQSKFLFSSLTFSANALNLDISHNFPVYGLCTEDFIFCVLEGGADLDLKLETMFSRYSLKFVSQYFDGFHACPICAACIQASNIFNSPHVFLC